LSTASAASTSSRHIEKLLRCGALQKLIILDRHRQAADTIDLEADAGSGEVSLASTDEALSFQESARKIAYGIRTAVGVQAGVDESVSEAAEVGNGIPLGTLGADDLSKEDSLIDVQTTVKERASSDNSDVRDDDNKITGSRKRFRALVSKFWLQPYTPSGSH
jgi:hypothetical protein